MPEYLSPGVYVEEVNTGSKPIEGVSTSTAGMVGPTERGPEDVPVLVTSNGEFRRIFGGELRLIDFTDGTERVHGYLPHAVQGFFANDGRRNYVVRVLPDDARHANRFLFDRGDVTSADTVLLRTAPQDSGTLVNMPLLYGLNVNDLSTGDWVRVGNGSRSEYRQVANATPEELHVSLGAPLGLSYAAGANIYNATPAYDGGFSNFVLAEPAARGDQVITVTEGAVGEAANLAGLADPIVEIGNSGVGEYIRVTDVTVNGAEAIITLETPLNAALQTDTPPSVRVVDLAAVIAAAPVTPPVLDLAASAGDILVYPDDNTSFKTAAGEPAAGDWVVIGDVSGTAFEIRQVGHFGVVSFDVGAYTDYPVRSAIQLVTLNDNVQTVSAVTDAQVFDVNDATVFDMGMSVDVGGEQGIIQGIVGNEITLTAALSVAPAAPSSEVRAVTGLTQDVAAGRVVISLANRVGLNAGDVIRIGTKPNEEYVSIARINGERAVAPDAGTVVLSSPLSGDHANGTAVTHQLDPVVDNTRQVMQTVLRADTGAPVLYVNDKTNFAVDNIVRVTTPGGSEAFHRLIADTVTINPGTIELAESIDFSHDVGSAVVEREALISVQAIDRGAWGNRLQVVVEDKPTSLVQAQLTAINPPQVISLSNFTGVEAGTVLELLEPDTQAVIDTPLKVVSVDRVSSEVELDGAGLTAAHIAAHNTAQMAGTNLQVRSREFSLSVFLLQRPDPAVPSRNNTVIDSESFLVSMDPRHSRYIHTVIGTTWTPGNDNDDDGNPLRRWDRRSEGESAYIRVRDVAAGNNARLESVRLGPEVLVDKLNSGQLRAARLPLSDGDDAIATIISQPQGDVMYLGINSDEPQDRTGIHALRNIQDISIVAVPGQTSLGVQQALINHCESDRYRFAVLDAHAPNRDTLVDVQTQRQAFDSKYAALYHPWLTIPEPLPANVSSIKQMPIPPSGHMMGVYARTDNTRGVHKAPANEVVRGITGLVRSLNSREHDLLNPFPININVIRNFRNNNRGLRIWGARCITSDSDYKYVNVRRLMIFLEASIDRGLQWVVFEPNAEPLWARVRRSITNFLTVVWRNGALEGTKPVQAFFVECDRTTMTQTDIDNGRLICEIGVAPVKPAEFVIIRIGLWTAYADQ